MLRAGDDNRHLGNPSTRKDSSVVAKIVRDRHSMIAHKSGNRPSQELKMGKLVAPPFALEADGREPAAGIRDKMLP
jgi:hypothetical protein